jgi:hypothetical protein
LFALISSDDELLTDRFYLGELERPKNAAKVDAICRVLPKEQGTSHPSDFTVEFKNHEQSQAIDGLTKVVDRFLTFDGENEKDNVDIGMGMAASWAEFQKSLLSSDYQSKYEHVHFVRVKNTGKRSGDDLNIDIRRRKERVSFTFPMVKSEVLIFDHVSEKWIPPSQTAPLFPQKCEKLFFILDVEAKLKD